MILHGIGALMPWNMFITAKEVSDPFINVFNYRNQREHYNNRSDFAVFCRAQVVEKLHGLRVAVRRQLFSVPRTLRSDSQFLVQLVEHIFTHSVSLID